MRVHTMQTKPLENNTHIVINDRIKECFIVDCGGDVQRIMAYIKENNLTLKALLLTHGHFDHMMGGLELQALGVPTYIGKEDSQMLSTSQNLGKYFGYNVKTYNPDYEFSNGDILNIAGFNIKVINTCGHTKGSYCFVVENCIFSGDTIFRGSYGRTDFAGGSMQEMINSFKNIIFKLDGDYEVYPGHGISTSLDYERKYNDILGDL